MKPALPLFDLWRDLIPLDFEVSVSRALASSIECADEAGPTSWGLRIIPGNLMLKVGPHEVLQVYSTDRRWLRLIVDRTQVHPSARHDDRLKFRGTSHYSGSYVDRYYRSAPNSEAWYVDLDDVDRGYEILRGAHSMMMRAAAKRRRQPHTVRTHQTDLVEHVASLIGRDLPQPAYLEAAGDALPEEVPSTFFEGGTATVRVNAYERSREARRACLRHFGYRCQVCERSLDETYGWIGKGVIHVHHVKPLAEIGGGYQVDPVADLRPVCPNCHAVLHARDPVYSIEELRAELVRRKPSTASPPGPDARR